MGNSLQLWKVEVLKKKTFFGLHIVFQFPPREELNILFINNIGSDEIERMFRGEISRKPHITV